MDETPTPAAASVKQRPLLPGIILIWVGALFLVANFADISLSDVWPEVIIALSAVFFVVGFRDRTKFGLLMPATILLIVGGIFVACEREGWYLMQFLWPLFILAPGLGFFMLFLFGNKDRSLLIPGGILTGLGFIFLLQQQGYARLWPLILIVVGLVLVLTRTPEQRKS